MEDVKALSENGVYWGSRQLINVPAGEQIGLAQPLPNLLPKDAMQEKTAQIVAIGGRIITPGSAVKTATEAQGDSESEHSVLSLIASNVSEAYSFALRCCAIYMNAKDNVINDISYKINQDFTRLTATPDMIRALRELYEANLLPETDMFTLLRGFNVIDPEKGNEDIKDELESRDPGINLNDDDEEEDEDADTVDEND